MSVSAEPSPGLKQSMGSAGQEAPPDPNRPEEVLAAVGTPEQASPPPMDRTPVRGEGPGGSRHTYWQILKSSVLIGGSSAFNVAIGLVRSKIIALLLGPAGFGLMGLYTSVANLGQSIAGMGINASGVRQIAAAVGTGETERIARTAAVLRRTSVALGLLGALLLIVLSRPVAVLTFGNAERVLSVALLSLAVLFRTVSDGQGALIQGLRRISDMARIGVLGGLVGTVGAVALVYLLGERGVVPALVAMTGGTLVYSWWYSRKVRHERTPLTASQVFREAAALLQLGFTFMASGMLMMGAAYAVRIFIVRHAGFEAAGLYQAAWTIGGLYVGFILQAMGADFYPRLTAAVDNHEECNRIVNEQAQVSLLLAGPGVIATLVLAPLVLPVFYSPAFREAAEILRWICAGATLQVITWPLGFIVIAKGKQAVFFWMEFAFAAVNLGLSYVLVRTIGVNGAGLAFFGSYLFHAAIVFPIGRWLTGFRWAAANARMATLYIALIAVVFASSYVLPVWPATAVGLVALLLTTVYSSRAIVRLVPADRLPGPFRRLLVAVRIAPPGYR